jgi:hypothetical protein
MASPVFEPNIRPGGEAIERTSVKTELRGLNPNPMDEVFLLLFVHKKKTLPTTFLPFYS